VGFSRRLTSSTSDRLRASGSYLDVGTPTRVPFHHPSLGCGSKWDHDHAGQSPPVVLAEVVSSMRQDGIRIATRGFASRMGCYRMASNAKRASAGKPTRTGETFQVSRRRNGRFPDKRPMGCSLCQPGGRRSAGRKLRASHGPRQRAESPRFDHRRRFGNTPELEPPGGLAKHVRTRNIGPLSRGLQHGSRVGKARTTAHAMAEQTFAAPLHKPCRRSSCAWADGHRSMVKRAPAIGAETLADGEQAVASRGFVPKAA
jgi:hypothetical protein